MGLWPVTQQDHGHSTKTALLVAFAACCSVLAPLNSTMIAVALPEIRDAFSVSRGTVGWLVSAYLIAMAVSQPVAGRLGDQLGRGRVVRVGLLLFIAVTLAAAFAPNFAALIALRVAQAIVGAGLIPNAVALLRERASTTELGRLNGYNAAAIAAAAGLGPLLGAAALAAGSWRFIFPIGLPCAIGALLLLPRLRLGAGTGDSGSRADWLGVALYTLLLVAVTALLGESRGGHSMWLLAGGWVAFSLALIWFVMRQRSASTPVAAWSLFRRRVFAAASMQVLLTNLAMYTTLLMVPFLVKDVLGGGAGTSGLLLGLMALFMGLAAPVGGRLSDARGRRLVALTGGGLVLLAALSLVAVLGRGVETEHLAVLLSLMGWGVGMSTGAAQTAAIESAPRTMAGAAAGTSSMMRYVGSIVGAGVLAGSLQTSAGAPPDAAAFGMLQTVIAVMAGAAVVAACLIHRFPVESEAASTVSAPTP